MTYQLLIETSSATYSAALAEEGSLIGSLERHRTAPGFDGIPGLVEELLRESGVGFPQLASVRVDQGPGHLLSIRAGVAYANAIAWSLGIPVEGVNSLDALALTVSSTLATSADEHSTLCVRRAGGDRVYAGHFDRSRPVRYSVVSIPDLKAWDFGERLLVAGSPRVEVLANLPDGIAAVDSGVDLPRVTDLLVARITEHESRGSRHIPLTPITETWEGFE